MRFGELPSDLRQTQDATRTLPWWFKDRSLGDLGDMAPQQAIDKLMRLKAHQEMSTRIPRIARRYTNIKPISPFFREDKATFGFGQTTGSSIGIGMAVLAGVGALVLIKWYLSK